MSFAGPPVPEGWATQWDANYQQWFFINLSTGISQWEPPAATQSTSPPASAPPSEHSHPRRNHPDQPPSYEESGPATPAETSEKKAQVLGSNNPYNTNPGRPGSFGPSDTRASADATEGDAELAARLQAEEDARFANQGSPGAAANYYSNPDPHAPQSPAPSTGDVDKGKGRKKGFFSKLKEKASAAASASSHGHGYSSRPVYMPPRPHHGSPHVAYFQQGPGYGPPGGYYPPQQGFGPGFGPRPVYGYPQRRHGGGGMGMAGAAALGVGGGLMGGALMANALDDGDDGGDFDGGFDGDFGDF